MTGSIQCTFNIYHFAKKVFTQSPNSCKRRQFSTLQFVLLFFLLRTSTRENPVDPRSVPTPCQHCANTVPTPVWPRCWHVPTPVWGQVLAHLKGKKCANVGTPTLHRQVRQPHRQPHRQPRRQLRRQPHRQPHRRQLHRRQPHHSRSRARSQHMQQLQPPTPSWRQCAARWSALLTPPDPQQQRWAPEPCDWAAPGSASMAASSAAGVRFVLIRDRCNSRTIGPMLAGPADHMVYSKFIHSYNLKCSRAVALLRRRQSR